MATTTFEPEDNLTDDARTVTRAPLPGALVLFSVDRVVHAALPLRDGAIDLGRDRLAEVGLVDARVSRRHAACAWQRGVWSVRDVGSRNGTSVDGAPCASEVRAGERAVVRVGDTIAWLVPDLGPYIERPVRVEGAMVVGATLAAVIDQIRAAADGRGLHRRAREDLYVRIARPVVALPPLRERREEIPSLVARELLSARLAPHASLIEACLVRAWPGNVRELIVEVSAAGRALQAPGDGRVRASDLGPTAGCGIAP